MAITKKETEHMAKLSRLKFTDSEQEEFINNFNNMLAHIDIIKNIDTENVQPCTNVFDLHNILREDIAKPSMAAEKLLANAPSTEGTAYLVPKVVE